MASTGVHIGDMFAALSDGTMPGEFNEDQTVYTFPTVISRNARGVPLLWTISVRLLQNGEPVPILDEMLKQPIAQLGDGSKGEITTVSKQEEGKEKHGHPTYVSSGKNLGKVNATNVITQALRDAFGLYNKQVKKASPDTESDQRPGADKPPGADKKERSAPTKGRSPIECLGAPNAQNVDSQPPPMLVKKIGASREATLAPKDFAAGKITLQRKYNGVRLVAYLACSPESAQKPTPTVVLYSRTKGDYPGHQQIRVDALPMLLAAPVIDKTTALRYGIPAKYIPIEGKTQSKESWAYMGPFGVPIVYLDGEVYLHGKPLNWISGQARKEADEGKLEFHAFDCFFPLAKALGHDMSSRCRQAYLDDMFARVNAEPTERPPHIIRVENFKPRTRVDMDKLCKGFLEEGYEGGIARKDWEGYRYSYNGYHSAHLVKIKPILDAEFKVVGFTEGRRGKDVGALIWICEVDEKHIKDPKDKTFNVVPKDMTYDVRYKLFKCLSQKVPDPKNAKKTITIFQRDVYGLPLTVEFPERTKTGKPSQAKALAFRTYEGGPDEDPIRKLLAECE
jgi:hypothetical protein